MSTEELLSRLDSVRTRADLSEFTAAMGRDFLVDREGWENQDIASFMEAMSAWIDAMDGYYKNKGEEFSEDQPWKTFAEMLYAARIYE